MVDVGSGDGRIACCSTILGLRSISIEIDTNLSVSTRRRLFNRRRVQDP